MVEAFNQRQGPSEAEQPDIVTYNEDFVVIRDKFPKGLIHWLVLPRKEMLEEVGQLTGAHVGLLRGMCEMGKQLLALARSELNDETLECWTGFHSAPSMKLLHLHFISSDLNGDRMTKPSHWISFTTPFFIRLPDMLRRLEQAGNPQIDIEAEKKLKKGKPTCPICKLQFKNNEDGVIEAKKHYQSCRTSHIEAGSQS